MTLNFDPSLCPFPPFEYRWALDKVDGIGQDNFGTRTFRGNVWHRALSGNQRFDDAVGWLLRPDVQGLTDGFIDADTGRLVLINPMKCLFPDLPAWWEDRAGWANGVYGQGRAPSADASGFVARHGGRIGANIINQDLESFEITRNYDSPISEGCKTTMVAIAANRAQLLKIPYDMWPLNPATGTVVHFGHREFTLKDCPGIVVWEFINGEMVARVREALRVAQTSGKAAPAPAPKPTPAPPTPPPAALTFTMRFRLPLRQAPGFNGTIVTTLPEGTTGAVIEGPVGKDGIEWFKAQIDGGGTGWVPASIVRTLDMTKAA